MSLEPLRPPSDGNGISPQSTGNGHTNGDTNGQSKQLHRVLMVRKRQGVTLRTAARRWNTDIEQVRLLEDETADLKLSQLYAWQELLDVPINELLVDTDLPLSAPVLRRAQLLRLMKTAMTLSEKSRTPEVLQLAEMMINQLVEIMPELKAVGPWQTNEGGDSESTPAVYHLPED